MTVGNVVGICRVRRETEETCFMDRLPPVRYMAEVLKEGQRLVDELFWEAMEPEDFIRACEAETQLQYLEYLYDEGEEWYAPF